MVSSVFLVFFGVFFFFCLQFWKAWLGGHYERKSLCQEFALEVINAKQTPSGSECFCLLLI